MFRFDILKHTFPYLRVVRFEMVILIPRSPIERFASIGFGSYAVANEVSI
jgi:hypothetical protein